MPAFGVGSFEASLGTGSVKGKFVRLHAMKA
jgi:hypothetical protein